MHCYLSYTEFTRIYERLDIANLVDRGESFYQQMMISVVQELEKKGKELRDSASVMMAGLGMHTVVI